MTLHVDSKETISTSALEVFMLLVKRSVNEVRSYLATEEAFSVLIPAVRSAGLEGTQKLNKCNKTIYNSFFLMCYV